MFTDRCARCSLQRQLDESVPVSDLENSTLKFQELTEKYRDLLERSNVMVAQAERESGFEVLSTLLYMYVSCYLCECACLRSK